MNTLHTWLKLIATFTSYGQSSLTEVTMALKSLLHCRNKQKGWKEKAGLKLEWTREADKIEKKATVINYFIDIYYHCMSCTKY